MLISFLKKINFKCTSAATAIEYGLISALIGAAIISATWETGQELGNTFYRVGNALDNGRQELLDGFYDLTAETRCNGFGSCGSKGNQGVWEGFKDIAMSNKAFDDLLVDRNSFAVGIFNEARSLTQEKLNMSNNSAWHKSIDQTEVRQAAQQVWLELAAEAEQDS